MNINGCISVIAEKNNKILFVIEGKDDMHGLYNLPGGRLELGENVIEGAKREFIEETSLDVTIMTMNGIYQYRSNTGNSLINFNFIGRVGEKIDQQIDEDIIENVWLTKEEIENLPEERFWNGNVIKQMIKDYDEKPKVNLNIIHEI